MTEITAWIEDIFLSTPSARRATSVITASMSSAAYFYPRPPRGGRRRTFPFPRGLDDFYPRPPRGGRQYRVSRLS